MKIKLLRNYFVEIWLLLVLAIAVTIVTNSLFLYKNFESSTIDTINRLNQDFLNETAKINEYVRRMIRISGMELFSEPAVRKLMSESEISNFEVITGIRRIDSVRNVGRFIHSIYIYNASRNYIYATTEQVSTYLENFEDSEIIPYILEEKSGGRMVPIARYAVVNERKIPVHSFVFYPNLLHPKGSQGALVINLTLDWLNDIIRQKESELYVIDLSGRVIYNPDDRKFLADKSGDPFIERIINSGERDGAFIEHIDGEKSLVIFAGEENLFFIRVYSYEMIMSDIRKMQSVTLLSFFGVLFFGIMVAFFLSRRLYRPIRNIVTILGKSGIRETQSEKSEIGFISTSIESITARASSLEASSLVQQALIRQEVLKELLMGNILGSKGIDELFSEYGILFNADGLFRIITARINPEIESIVPEISETIKLQCPDSVLYAICFTECAVFIFQGRMQNPEKMVTKKLKESKAGLIVCSEDIKGAKELASEFARIKDILRFSFLFSKGSLVSTRDVKFRSVDFEYPTEIEKQILHAVRTGQTGIAVNNFHQFIQNVSAYRYEHFRFSIRRLYVSVQLFAEELRNSKSGFRPGSDRISVCNCTVFDELPENPDSVEEIAAPFVNLFNSVKQILEESKSARLRELSGDVMKLISEKYPDTNLTLQSIADSMNFSASYLSRAYKETTGISVADAINDYRIDIAKKLLLNEDVPAREIALRVGFTNENYFYTLFHKKAGVTPSVFRKEHVKNKEKQ